jgi:hypothetical protein
MLDRSRGDSFNLIKDSSVGTCESRSNKSVIVARDEDNYPVQIEIAVSEIEEEDGQPLILHSTTSLMPTGLDQLLTPRNLMLWFP